MVYGCSVVADRNGENMLALIEMGCGLCIQTDLRMEPFFMPTHCPSVSSHIQRQVNKPSVQHESTGGKASFRIKY